MMKIDNIDNRIYMIATCKSDFDKLEIICVEPFKDNVKKVHTICRFNDYEQEFTKYNIIYSNDEYIPNIFKVE